MITKYDESALYKVEGVIHDHHNGTLRMIPIDVYYQKDPSGETISFECSEYKIEYVLCVDDILDIIHRKDPDHEC